MLIKKQTFSIWSLICHAHSLYKAKAIAPWEGARNPVALLDELLCKDDYAYMPLLSLNDIGLKPSATEEIIVPRILLHVCDSPPPQALGFPMGWLWGGAGSLIDSTA